MRVLVRKWLIGAFALASLVVCLSTIATADKGSRFEGFTKYTHYQVDYRVNADSTYVESHQWALKVIDEQGLAGANEASVSYSEQLQSAKIVKAYTLKKDGRRIEVPSSNFQEQSNTGRGKTSPMFSDIRTIVIAYPDVAVGDTVVLSYKLTQKEALFPGKFSFTQSFSKFEEIEDAEIGLSAPASLPLQVAARGVSGGELAPKGGRRIWRWSYQNREIAAPEADSVSPEDYGPLIVASTFKDYGELAAAYSARARAKAAVTNEVRAMADSLTRNLHTPRDQAKALYDWVAENIQYVEYNVGVGSVVPHDANLILRNRMGDCKDHATLLEALLAAKGIASTPVLIDADPAYTLPKVATSDAINHVINYIPSLNLYVDSTARYTPFGDLPYDDSDKPVIPTDDFTEIRRTPPLDYARDGANTTSVMNIHDDGSADGQTTVEVSGLLAEEVRQSMMYLQPNMEDRAVRHSLERSGYTGSGTMWKDDPKVASETYRYGDAYQLADAVNLPGPGAIAIRNPLMAAGTISSLLRGGNEPDRTINYQCFGAYSRERYTFHLPKGLKVLAIPRNVELSRAHLMYRARYQLKGNVVTADREIEEQYPSNVCTPADARELKAFAPGVRRDLRAQIVYR